MEVERILQIKDDKEFLDEACKFLESAPSDKKKGVILIKLNSEGRTQRKKLYLSLAHGKKLELMLSCYSRMIDLNAALFATQIVCVGRMLDWRLLLCRTSNL